MPAGLRALPPPGPPPLRRRRAPCRYIFTKSSFLLISEFNCATRGVGVVGTSTYTIIPHTTDNVMRPKRPSWTSPHANANRPRPFIASILYPYLRHVVLNSLVFQIYHACLRRELPCSICTPANQTSRIEHGTHASNPPPTSPKIYGYVEH
jgi:hypothetical protein